MSMFLESLSEQARYAELIQMLRPEYPFVQLGYHLGATADPTSRTLRVVREGRHLIKKEYLGQLNGKTENEISLLMAAAWKGLLHTASFKSVHAMTCHLNIDADLPATEGIAPTMELLMKNYGLDLEDWFFLFRKAKLYFLDSPYFYLSIWHYVLSAYKELHQANFVQVDVKADNICVALPAQTDAGFFASPRRVAFTFDLKQLTLIDLGEALHPDINKRVLLFHRSGMVLGPGNHYISRHYKKQKSLVTMSDMKPLRNLDWRIDFYPLACMAEEWNRINLFPAEPPDYLHTDEKKTYAEAIDVLHQLPQWLRSKDTDPSTEAGDLPHDALIKKIGALVNLDKWGALELSLPVNIQAASGAITDASGHLRQTKDDKLISFARSVRQPPAQKTQLDKAPERQTPTIPHRKIASGDVSKQFCRRSRHRKSRSIAASEPDAVYWYRKTLNQDCLRCPDIDLLC